MNAHNECCHLSALIITDSGKSFAACTHKTLGSPHSMLDETELLRSGD